MADKVMTPEFRASFVHVFNAKENQQGKLRYSLVMLFETANTDFVEMKRIVKEAIVGKWGTDKTKWPKNLRMPFRDGAEKTYDGYGEGIIFCSATSVSRPGLVDDRRQPIIDHAEFYAGCYARATITAYAYDVKGNKGVSFGLQNIQKLNDGDPFSGKASAEEDFDAIKKPEDEAEGAAADDNNPLNLG